MKKNMFKQYLQEYAEAYRNEYFKDIINCHHNICSLNLTKEQIDEFDKMVVILKNEKKTEEDNVDVIEEDNVIEEDCFDYKNIKEYKVGDIISKHMYDKNIKKPRNYFYIIYKITELNCMSRLLKPNEVKNKTEYYSRNKIEYADSKKYRINKYTTNYDYKYLKYNIDNFNYTV